MSFEKQLNNYINIINCSSKELSAASNLSAGLISKYRSGERTPRIESEQFQKLVHGIYILSCEKNINLKKDDILDKFKNEINPNNINFETFRQNFDYILSELNISISSFSSYLNYDPSFISRIRTGNRKPANITGFIDDFVKFVVFHYQTEPQKALVANIINTPIVNLSNNETYISTLKRMGMPA